MVQQQQKDNGYRTDYDRPIPMVDGVEGLNHSGSYLDIEACLEAQLFRLRQYSSLPKHRLGHPIEAVTTTAEKGKTPDQSAPETILVWPAMEQIRFTHQTPSPYYYNAEKSIKRYVEQGCKIVQLMRLDIKVLQ